MKHKLYAFWEHDIPPYVLGGEVTEIKSNGRVCVKGFTGYSFLPLQILPLEEGRAKQKEIDLALKNYKNTIKKAEEELRSHTKQLSLQKPYGWNGFFITVMFAKRNCRIY